MVSPSLISGIYYWQEHGLCVAVFVIVVMFMLMGMCMRTAYPLNITTEFLGDPLECSFRGLMSGAGDLIGVDPDNTVFQYGAGYIVLCHSLTPPKMKLCEAGFRYGLCFDIPSEPFRSCFDRQFRILFGHRGNAVSILLFAGRSDDQLPVIIPDNTHQAGFFDGLKSSFSIPLADIMPDGNN